ncbi:MAG TPA: ATP-binding protein [Cyclobacteriaceae bacterium]|nr:ATP-binding protein [Cyclobacteriaceae bacterium]
MDITEEVLATIGSKEGDQLEYKAVLPPSRNIAQLIAGFANTKGGLIILGVVEQQNKYVVNGLSEDFKANGVIHKAIDLLTPKPRIDYQYVAYKNKNIYAIKIQQSSDVVLVEGLIYVRHGDKTVLKNPSVRTVRIETIAEIKTTSAKIALYRELSTGSKSKLLDHYQSILNILDDLGNLLYPVSSDRPTGEPEGKVLMRILFSSCVDNFETYLSDLLYEIYLAKPETLKSDQQVTIKEVLNCADMQEFVHYWSKKKLSKLQRGSVKGFIVDNEQISSLNVVDGKRQESIEDIFQIRHLYSHRNGIVDDKFVKAFPGRFQVNTEHQLTTNHMLEHINYLMESIHFIDQAAVGKYLLATL